MENTKYDDLILELIQNHRKYSQVAEYTDSIIEDVHKRADSILGAIDNDTETIEGYLKKVVSVSIVTISQHQKSEPKRNSVDATVIEVSEETPVLNEIKSEASDTNVTVLEESVPVADEIDLNSAFNELIPEADNSAEEINNRLEEFASTSDNNESPVNATEEDIFPQDETSPDILQEPVADFEEPPVNLDLTVKNDSNFTENIDSNDIEINNTIAEITPNEILSQDNTDNMEIGITDTEVVVDELVDNEIPQDVVLQNADDTDNMEIGITDTEVVVDELIDNETSQDVVLQNADDTDIVLSGNLETDILNNGGQDVDLLEVDNASDTEFLLSPNDNIGLSSNIETQDTAIEIDETPSAFNSETEESLVETEITEPTEDNNLIYNTENTAVPDDNCEIEIKFNEEEVQEELCCLHNKYADLHILNVFDLKYKENATISQISETLSMSEDNVTEALCKIIGIVED